MFAFIAGRINKLVGHRVQDTLKMKPPWLHGGLTHHIYYTKKMVKYAFSSSRHCYSVLQQGGKVMLKSVVFYPGIYVMIKNTLE